MKKTLNDFILNKKFISVYCGNDTEKFFYGKPLATDGTDFSLLMVSPYGSYDGILIKEIESIFRLDFDGQYEKKMKRLTSFCVDSQNLPKYNSDLKPELLSFALENNQIISVELLDSGIENVVGFVKEISNGKCVILQVDEYGNEDGYSYIYLNDITQIVCNSQTENKIFRLWKSHNV